jgi:hypothetical protein
MTTNDIVRPPYYMAPNGLWAADVIEAFGLSYNLGTAVAYILRHGKKGSAADAVNDLRKAAEHIKREIAVCELKGTP